MKLSEIRISHSWVAARCHTTNYYADSHCIVVPSVVKKGMYKFAVDGRTIGHGATIGNINKCYASPVYIVNKLYTAKEIKALYKSQIAENKSI